MIRDESKLREVLDKHLQRVGYGGLKALSSQTKLSRQHISRIRDGGEIGPRAYRELHNALIAGDDGEESVQLGTGDLFGVIAQELSAVVSVLRSTAFADEQKLDRLASMLAFCKATLDSQRVSLGERNQC